jgi:hypothetical protein
MQRAYRGDRWPRYLGEHVSEHGGLSSERVGGSLALPQEQLLAARVEQEAIARVEPLALGRYLHGPDGERVRQTPHVVQGVLLRAVLLPERETS